MCGQSELFDEIDLQCFYLAGLVRLYRSLYGIN